MREQFARADIFVLPSLAEGIPVVLMEAMASGVPCVTTPVNGIPELIEHERPACWRGPGDVDSLAEQLRRLIARARRCAARWRWRRATRCCADFDLRTQRRGARPHLRAVPAAVAGRRQVAAPAATVAAAVPPTRRRAAGQPAL